MSNKLKHDMANTFLRIEILFNRVVEKLENVQNADLDLLEKNLKEMLSFVDQIKATEVNDNH